MMAATLGPASLLPTCIQFRRPRATGRIAHELWATDMIVSAVTVALEYALEVAQEPLGTFPLPPKPEVKDHRSGRMAVLPEVSLVIFAPTIVHLYSHGG